MHGTAPCLFASAQKIAPVKIITVMYTFTLPILVPPESNIKSVSDLVGKTVAVRLGTTWEIFLHLMLAKYGLTIKNITVLNMESAEIRAALLARKVDAGCLDLPFAYDLIKKEKFRVLFSSKELPGSADPQVIAVDARFAERHPDMVVAALKIWYRVADYWYAHPEEAKEYMLEKMSKDLGLNLTMDYIDFLWENMDKQTLESNYKIWFNSSAPGNIWTTLQRFGDFFFYKVATLPSPIASEELVDHTFIKALYNIKESAIETITIASNKIDEAKAKGVNVDQAISLLNQAKEKLSKGDYENAFKFASDALSSVNEAIISAERTGVLITMYTIAATIIVIVVIIILLFYLKKRKK
jgi:ABC-type nitrate/sulfonate/bicarbonate transport system substrate-binding protein